MLFNSSKIHVISSITTLLLMLVLIPNFAAGQQTQENDEVKKVEFTPNQL